MLFNIFLDRLNISLDINLESHIMVSINIKKNNHHHNKSDSGVIMNN